MMVVAKALADTSEHSNRVPTRSRFIVAPPQIWGSLYTCSGPFEYRRCGRRGAFCSFSEIVKFRPWRVLHRYGVGGYPRQVAHSTGLLFTVRGARRSLRLSESTSGPARREVLRLGGFEVYAVTGIEIKDL